MPHTFFKPSLWHLAKEQTWLLPRRLGSTRRVHTSHINQLEQHKKQLEEEQYEEQYKKQYKEVGDRSTTIDEQQDARW